MALVSSRWETRLASILFLVLLFWTASSFPTRWDSESFAAQTSPLYYRVQAVLAYLSIPLCALLLLNYYQTITRRFVAAWPWTVLCVWTFLSILWSVKINATIFSSAVVLAWMTVIGFVATRLDDREVSRLVAWYVIIFAAINLALGVALPDYGMMNTAKFSGLLRGLYSHKNLLGETTVTLLLWIVCARFGGMLKGPLGWASIGLGLATTLWTWSTTSIMMLGISSILLVGLTSAYALRMRTATLSLAIFAFVLLAVVIIPVLSDSVLGYFGKDLTFTGRDVIWRAYLDLAAERPLTGFGFQAIQNSQDYGIDIRFENGLRPSPHSSFIQLYVDLGLPALIFFVFANLLIIAKGIRLIGLGDPFGLFCAVYPIGYSICGLMESGSGMYISAGFVLTLYMAMRPPMGVRAPIARARAAEQAAILPFLSAER